MYKFLLKNGQTVALGLGILVIAIFLISVITGLSGAGYDMSTDLNKLTAEQKDGITFFNSGLMLTVIMVIAAFALALVVFGAIDLIKFPKSAMKFGLGLIGLLVIFGILYSTSDAETAGRLGRLIESNDISDTTSKMISGGIWTTLGLAGVAVLAMILGELRNAFK